MPFQKKKLYMRYSGIFLFLFAIACICMAGCTQSSGTGPVTTAVPLTSPSPAESATTAPPAVETAIPTAAATVAPQQVVTIIHQISQVKDMKDSELLFSLQVPVEWNISTYRLANPENFVGFMYQTDLVRNNTFYIQTYINYEDRDQNYRDECRQWSPATNETTVTINGIIFDRFESTAFEKEDYDKVVASFRYYGKDDVSTMPGEEIPRITSSQQEGGGGISAMGGSSSGSSGGSSSFYCGHGSSSVTVG